MRQFTIDDAIASNERARAEDPATSHAAAASLDASAQFANIAGTLARMPGKAGTFHEIAAASGLTPHQTGRRLPELERMGWVERLEETRAGPTGRQCAVWRLK